MVLIIPLLFNTCEYKVEYKTEILVTSSPSVLEFHIPDPDSDSSNGWDSPDSIYSADTLTVTLKFENRGNTHVSIFYGEFFTPAYEVVKNFSFHPPIALAPFEKESQRIQISITNHDAKKLDYDNNFEVKTSGGIKINCYVYQKEGEEELEEQNVLKLRIRK